MFDCNFAFHWMQIFHWLQIGGIEMSRNTSPAFQLNPEFPPSVRSLWRLFLVCNVASLFCHVWEVRSLKIGFWMEEWSTLCMNYMGPSTEVEVTIKVCIKMNKLIEIQGKLRIWRALQCIKVGNDAFSCLSKLERSSAYVSPFLSSWRWCAVVLLNNLLKDIVLTCSSNNGKSMNGDVND